MAVRDDFLNGMSSAACTVSIVTTDGSGGRQGATVSAMASVSADTPEPTLLVCINETSSTAQAIKTNGTFCVNVLRDNQSSISDCFAKRWVTHDGDKFSCAEWVDDINGSPRVKDGLVAFSCTVSSWQKVGTHYIFFGAVNDVRVSEQGSPLIYANRSYGTSVPIQQSVQISSAPKASLRIGCFHTFGPYIVPQVLSQMTNAESALSVRLVEGDQDRILGALKNDEIDVALVYDSDLGDGFDIEHLSSLSPYVLMAELHPLAKHDSLTLQDLTSWPMILLDAPPSGDYFLSLFKARGLEPSVFMRSTSFEMVRGLVAHGLGFSVLATKPACPMSYDGYALTDRPLLDSPLTRSISLVTMHKRASSVTTDEFKSVCRKLFNERIAAG